jgi:murein DD-endopeptidase MepM/ murein hydrolase activator NlpD
MAKRTKKNGIVDELLEAVRGTPLPALPGLPVRERYFFTPANRLRLRYIVLPAFMTMSMALALFSFSNMRERAYAELASLAPAAGIEEMADAGPSDDPNMVRPELVLRKPVHPKTETVKIGRGDTLAGVLLKAGISAGEAHHMVAAVKKYFDPRDMKAGQALNFKYAAGKTSDDFLLSEVKLPISPLKSVSLKRGDDGLFVPALTVQKPERRVYAKKANIEVSLFGSALKAGISSTAIAQAIRILSWDVDFQRDIRQGDSMEILYDQTETPGGQRVSAGDILYVMLNVGGRDIRVYRYEHDGDVDYYTADGASLRKALLKTPVDGARLSSGFGMRLHPVLGYTKIHKGIDFAAPIGTPIYAAGDGKIERIGPWSSFGNYIRIRHNSTLSTAYAHMSRFAASLRAGSRVKQGQVIGYIGRTGRVTGPHLHYEVLIDGSQVNPKSVKLPQGDVLRGKSLAAFKRQVDRINRQFESLSEEKYASLENGDTPFLK